MRRKENAVMAGIFLFPFSHRRRRKKNEREKFSRHLMGLDIPSKKVQHAAKEHRFERDNLFCKRNALFCVTSWWGRIFLFFFLLDFQYNKTKWGGWIYTVRVVLYSRSQRLLWILVMVLFFPSFFSLFCLSIIAFSHSRSRWTGQNWSRLPPRTTKTGFNFCRPFQRFAVNYHHHSCLCTTRFIPHCGSVSWLLQNN